MRVARLVVLLAGIFLGVCAHADPKGDALAKCLGDNTTGRDRIELARWVFLTMAAHPELATVVNATATDIDAENRTIGALVTRLLTEQCADQTKALLQDANGSDGMRFAFEYLGKMAMQEIMNNPAVQKSGRAFLPYLDKGKFEKLKQSN